MRYSYNLLLLLLFIVIEILFFNHALQDDDILHKCVLLLLLLVSSTLQSKCVTHGNTLWMNNLFPTHFMASNLDLLQVSDGGARRVREKVLKLGNRFQSLPFHSLSKKRKRWKNSAAQFQCPDYVIMKDNGTSIKWAIIVLEKSKQW